MCGIAGILLLTPPGEAARAAVERTPFDAIPEQWLNILDDSIRHRGPDGQGRFRDRAVRADGTVVDVALVHRRLSIIDHGGGAQPMVSQLPSQRGLGASLGQPSALSFQPLLFHGKPNDPIHYQRLPDLRDTLAVVFNGCIYNHRELRAELQAKAHHFTTDHSDTEVLLHGWREWGAGVPDDNDGMPVLLAGLAERLEDMFAFAVWSRCDGSVTLARDQMGQKPLYCTCIEHGGGAVLAFASTIPGLLKLHRSLGVDPALDRAHIIRWVRFGADGRLPIHSVDEALPSHVARSSAKGWGFHWFIDRHRYPRMSGVLSRAAVVLLRSQPLGPIEVESLLRASIRSRLEADVQVGCFLSGGVDSSLIAAFARDENPAIRTFTVRMPTEAFDESRFAQEVAATLGTAHQTLPCDANPAADLYDLIGNLGLPFGDSSLLPTHWLSRAVRSEAPVALSGDGGDEMFGGYERYRGANLLRLWPALALWPGRPDRSPTSKRSRLHRLADAARHDRYRDLRSIFPHSDLQRLSSAEEVKSAFESERGWGALTTGADAAMNEDIHAYLPDDLMRKSDTASMRTALEVRSPFLDPLLSAVARNATLHSLMPWGQRKGLLRAVARRHLPAHIVDRPKMGFAIPIGEWFRSDYGGMRTLLLDHMNSAEPFGPPSLGIDLNMAYVRQMLDEHLGTGKSGMVTRDHSQRLYMLLVLSIWARWLGSLRA
ncbi:MAG: asparagine synthase (glutamine-hydrolyzing) [Phycisphaerales bacterium]|nr:asparagine synthase (glutamine-hydrolyzing) [Phycisphaerales bacterium]